MTATPEQIREAMTHGEKAHRRVFASGKIPSNKEQDLRREIRECERMHEEYPSHSSEIQLIRARDALRKYLRERRER